MQRELGEEYQGLKKIQFLKDNCDRVEEVGYMKQFTSDEIVEFKDNLSETAITINDIEEEKKEAMKVYKDQLKPLTVQKKTLLKNIKTKAEWVKEECYQFIDHEARLVGYYNSEGVLVESRQMRPDESQLTFKIKSGTNN